MIKNSIKIQDMLIILVHHLEKDLQTVQAAIRTLTQDKAAEYSIGNRRFKRQDLATLIARESQLKSIVFSERRASMIAQGLGDPKTMFVRF